MSFIRGQVWAGVEASRFDLAVIGGGIMGTGIARDAAMRGLRVVLFEKEDFGYGTTAASTRLIHGGLRYLEMYDFKLVREDLREREVLLRLAPHLVFPLAFVLPLYDRSLYYRLRLRAGMLAYDVLSFDKSLPGHRFLSRRETLDRVPALSPAGLQGAVVYYDAIAPRTERLCVENVIAARDHGAVILNHAQVVGLLRDGQRVTGVQVVDQLIGERREARARVVVNASGPWLNEVAGTFGGHGPLIRTTKGSHLVMPKVSDDALVLFAEHDQRLLFVVPWLDFSYLGTTDTDYAGSMDGVRATGDDLEYLLSTVRNRMPGEAWDRVYYTIAGVRSLARIEGVPGSSVSRRHIVFDHAERDGLDGLLSLVGGKLTAYRGISHDVVNQARRKLGKGARSRTVDVPLPGGGTGPLEEYLAREVPAAAGRYPLDREQVEHLIRLYGTRYEEVARLTMEDLALARRLHPDHPDSLAQVRHAVEQEHALTLADYMFRRSDMGFSAGRGMEAAPAIAEEMGGILGWDARRRERDLEEYNRYVERSREAVQPAGFPT